MYRYRLVASKPTKLDFEHRRKTKLGVGDVVEEIGKPPVRVKKIDVQAFALFGLKTRWLSRRGVAEVELEAPGPDAAAMTKGISDQQF